jgi:hypothetical protein
MSASIRLCTLLSAPFSGSSVGERSQQGPRAGKLKKEIVGLIILASRVAATVQTTFTLSIMPRLGVNHGNLSKM